MRPVFENLPPWESLHQAWLGQIEFDDGLERERLISATTCFLGLKKYRLLPKLLNFQLLKIHTITLR